MSGQILQIVPRLPGAIDGVTDYALNLSEALARDHGLTSVFLTGDELDAGAAETCVGAILHYVSYGYQKRGVPFRLVDLVRALRRNSSARWIVTFHEIFASGPPWKSAFWLHPWQVRIAHKLIDLADVCFVSNPVVASKVRAHAPNKPLRMAPVMSNLGAPAQLDFASTCPHRWTICGGTESILRSLDSFQQLGTRIPADFAPQHLDVIGGRDADEVRAVIETLSRTMTVRYHPQVSATEASALLAECTFAWLDYFGRGKVWPGMILKSGVFAAYSAHGVLPVLSHDEPPLEIDGDPLPGPWSLARFPELGRLREARQQLFRWYHAHAASSRIAQLYAECFHELR